MSAIVRMTDHKISRQGTERERERESVCVCKRERERKTNRRKYLVKSNSLWGKVKEK